MNSSGRISAVASGIVMPLQNWLEADIQGVGWYDRNTHEFEYTADSLDRLDLDIDGIADDLRLETLSVPAQEGLYGAGNCRCVVRCFDELTVLVFPTGRATGLVVAVRSHPKPPLQDVIEHCREMVQHCRDHL